jgi:hypothetical protein
MPEKDLPMIVPASFSGKIIVIPPTDFIFAGNDSDHIKIRGICSKRCLSFQLSLR